MGWGVIMLDTSGLFALLNRADPDHEPVKEVLLEDSGSYLALQALHQKSGLNQKSKGKKEPGLLDPDSFR